MSVTTSTTENVLLKGREYAHAQSDMLVEKQALEHVSRVRTPHLKVMQLLFSTAPALVLGLLALIAWYASTASGHVNSLFLPVPADVLTSLSDGVRSGMYLSNTLVTVQESIAGFLLALTVALPLGYGLVKSRLLSKAVQPYLAAGQAIPAIVIAPVLVIWLGYGRIPNVLVCMLVVLFPMVMNTVLGLQTIDHQLLDAARVEGASGWSLLAHVEFPLALPALLAAIRTGFTLSITGALVGEFVQGGDQGLGSLVLIAKNQLNTPFLFATLVVLAVLAALYYSITWLLVKAAEAVY